MRTLSLIGFCLLTMILASFSAPLLAADGRISGRVTRADGLPLQGVVVEIIGRPGEVVTGADGRYLLAQLPQGNYAIEFRAGDHTARASDVVVTKGATTTLDRSFDWNIAIAETITVNAVSRRRQRITDAPAAVTAASEEEIKAAAPTGQAPRIVENAPGVDFTQSGLYDFNFTVRGFNRSLNRRILTLIDGRDPSAPFLGAQEWAAVSYPIDEFASVELVRGPGSALYGSNAYSGVLNMTTKPPHGSEGGRLMVTAGELETKRADVRHAGRLAANWYYRVVAGYQRSGDFTVSRRDGVEYQGLPRERVLRVLDNINIRFAGLRIDRESADGNLLTAEAGLGKLSGPTFQTGIGRVQVTDAARPWTRISYNTRRYNFLGYYDARNANGQLSLSSGAKLYEHSYSAYGEAQTNRSYAGERVRLVGGFAYKRQKVDSADPRGVQTLMTEKKSEDQRSSFGQVELDASRKVTLVAAARYDDSTLYSRQFSPRAAAVFSVTSHQSLRVSYGRAFQRPNYSELFLHVQAAPPVRLSSIENAFKPLLGGVSLGFAAVPVLALGNSRLDVEKVQSKELGYSALWGQKLFVTADLYKSRMSDFVTNLLPGVNPAFSPYRVPAGVDPAVAAKIVATLRAQLPATPIPLFTAMTNLPDGSPAFVLSSTNAGKVDTKGGEVSFDYYLNSRVSANVNYSRFEFKVRDEALNDVLLPNAPRNKWNFGVAYRNDRIAGRLSYRWVEQFAWASGVFRGDVPAYGVVNLSARWKASERFSFGGEAANLLDNRHRETFGGDVLRRRALAFVELYW
jgi:outer membrane receptor for ferrienterochelin and colicins